MSRIRNHARLVFITILLVLPPPRSSAASRPADDSSTIDLPRAHVMLNGRPGLVVRDAVEGALRRIHNPRCESLVGELTDEQGRPLAWNLSETGMTPVEYLAAMRFVDGHGLRQCDLDTTVAVTRPYSRVIFVCGPRFAGYFSHWNARGEVIILHEFLHSLGLGENPPSSAEITEIVARRCGD